MTVDLSTPLAFGSIYNFRRDEIRANRDAQKIIKAEDGLVDIGATRPRLKSLVKNLAFVVEIDFS